MKQFEYTFLVEFEEEYHGGKELLEESRGSKIFCLKTSHLIPRDNQVE